MSFHPRLGILGETFAMALDSCGHFLMAFLVVFILLGSMAFFLFGDRIQEVCACTHAYRYSGRECKRVCAQFDSFSRALHTQFAMLTGLLCCFGALIVHVDPLLCPGNFVWIRHQEKELLYELYVRVCGSIDVPVRSIGACCVDMQVYCPI